jgi:lysophospholipase L1-like esterase
VPEVGIDVPSALIRMQLTPREISIAPTMEEYRERQRRTLAILERDAARYGARLIPVERALCDDVRCRVTRDGRSLYADDDHLSADGAAAIAPLLTAALQSPPELLLTNTSR